MTLKNSYSLEDRIWESLRTCYDPEIPVNIVDLGLIYKINIVEIIDDKFEIEIYMTLTSMWCGMGSIIIDDVKQKVSSISEVRGVMVKVVFDPPWDRSMMSEQAKLELGL
jgi:probable FeS assembly SUF system protein SufT